MEPITKSNSLPLRNLKITDRFWQPYVQLVKQKLLPHQWNILNDRIPGTEPSHCIENFRIAAGEKEGSFYGAVFQDSDVAKWLEAVAYTLESEPNPLLEELADDTIELLGRAQQNDGYLNTYFTIEEPHNRFTKLTEGHELYTAGHTIEAAVAYYNATGKKRFLEIVSRMADLICDTFGSEEGRIHGYPGHQEIELALVKLYRVTGNRRYLETAEYFINSRGTGENFFVKELSNPDYKLITPEFAGYDPLYSQSHLPVREQETAEGHCVRAVYMYCAMADLACECQDNELLEACKGLWNSIVQKRMHITSGLGSSGLLERFTTDYDLPNGENYSETCASVGLALFGKRMSQLTRDASYMDIVEKALYNTILAGIALDGESFFYVNPLEVWPDNCIPRTSREHVKPVRQKWFPVSCCPTNIARTLASLGQYIYFQEKEKIYINLYIASDTELSLDKCSVGIRQKTGFPYEGKAVFEISSESEQYMELFFRVPAYAENYGIRINGIQQELHIHKNYALITGTFKQETIEVSFDAPAAFIRANPKVRADAGKVAIVKGPLVYCLEEVDNGDNLSALYVDTKTKPKEYFDGILPVETLVIEVKGKRLADTQWKENELYSVHEPVLQDVTLKAVPYCFWCNRKPGEMTVWIKELLP